MRGRAVCRLTFVLLVGLTSAVIGQVPSVEESAKRLYDSGVEFLNSNRYEQALKDFDAVVTSFPRSAVAAVSWRKPWYSAAACSSVSGGDRRVLAWPARGALPTMTSARFTGPCPGRARGCRLATPTSLRRLTVS